KWLNVNNHGCNPWPVITSYISIGCQIPWVAPMVIHIQPLRGFKELPVEPINATIDRFSY
ncbi:MAG TPA: hypothetical protein VGK10_00440, partial [Prolixibacteraceae bacterium]